MSCYHPIYAIRSDRCSNKSLKRQVKIIGPLESTGRDLKLLPLADYELLLPCGHCIGCRMDYSRKWADRMMLELDHTGKAVFITLTYNDKHLPATEVDYNGELCEYGAPTLCKRDLQLFFKRLRKKFPDTPLRYYACGEYGSPEKTCRPHYHIILFGLSLDDLAEYEPDKNLRIVKVRQMKKDGKKVKTLIYTSSIIQEAWSIYQEEFDFFDPIGFVSVCEVNWNTCAYVSRYVQKKIFQDKLYLQQLYECEPEFSVMSRRPGIGGYFPLDHPDVFDYNTRVVGNKEVPIPSYFLDFLSNPELSCYNPILYHDIKEQKKEYSSNKLMSKLYQSDLGYIDTLKQSELEKLYKTSALPRDGV